jgi:hypothetical protein
LHIYYHLPLKGGGDEGVLEKSKETPPSSSPKREGEFGTSLRDESYIDNGTDNHGGR